MAYYRISVLLAGGERVESPAFESRDAAEAELSELRNEMGYNSPVQRSWLAVQNAMQTIKAANLLEEPGRPPSA